MLNYFHKHNEAFPRLMSSEIRIHAMVLSCTVTLDASLCATSATQTIISVLPKAKGKMYWESMSWAEPATTTNVLAPPKPHIKEKSVPKAY